MLLAETIKRQQAGHSHEEQSLVDRQRLYRVRLTAEESELRRETDTARRKRTRTLAANLHAAHRYSETEPELYHLGAMDAVCESCDARHFQQELTGTDKNVFTTCCQKGKIVLDPTVPDNFPDVVQKLLDGSHSLSKPFFEHIRKYNSAMAFASVITKLHTVPGAGPFTYRISGQFYHCLGSAHVPENVAPRYGQLYFVDSADALGARSSQPVNENLNGELLTILDSTMRSCNPFADAYKMMREVEQEEQQTAQQEGRLQREVQLIFDNDRRKAMRDYAPPRCNEVAAVVIGNQTTGFPEHSLAVTPRMAKLKKIPVINADCDPLSYPLFFPTGLKGFHPHIPNQVGKDVSMLQVRLKFLYEDVTL